MKAVRFHKPKDLRVEDVPDARVEQPTDAVLRVTRAAICGSDLHIYNGYIPQTRTMTLGHEFMGVVEEVGSRVTRLKKGDRVIVPFPISCGTCWFCSHDLETACERSNPEKYGPEGGILTEKGGGLYGYTDLYGGYDGGWAEYVRVPWADVGPRRVPEGLEDEQVLLCTDVIPTAWTANDWGEVGPGTSVAVFGCGPVGLLAQRIARMRGAEPVFGLDVLDYRVEAARRLCGSETLRADADDAVDRLRAATGGRGPDVVIEAVGLEAKAKPLHRLVETLHGQSGNIHCLRTCASAVRRGGKLVVMGVYGTTYDNFPLGQLFDKGVTLRAGQATAVRYADAVLEAVADGDLRADDIITHRVDLDGVPDAFKTFNDREDGCIKVVIRPS